MPQTCGTANMPHTGWFYESFFDPLLGPFTTYYSGNVHQGTPKEITTSSIFDQ